MSGGGRRLALVAAAAIVAAAACGRVVPAGDALTDGDAAAEDGSGGECPDGLARCGGACVDTKSDRLNCGGCGGVCQGADHATGECDGGTCKLACAAGWVDLDKQEPNGCEYECTFTSNTDTCNGFDDDCDGAADNFEAGSCRQFAAIPCETACGTTGTGACGGDCRPVAGVCAPPDEACNGADDDCDGGTDETFACARGQEADCTTTCGSTGRGTCNDDCSPAQAGACTPGGEACNWIDDDCDTVADEETYEIKASNLVVTDGSVEVARPLIAYGTTSYVVAWEDWRDGHPSELYTTALRPDGTKIPASDIRLVGNANGENMGSITWNGAKFGLVYYSNFDSTNNELWVATIDVNAERRHSQKSIIANQQQFPSIAWDGSAWGVSWTDDRDVAGQAFVRFARVSDVDLTMISGSDQAVSSMMDTIVPYSDIAWSGSRYGIVWNEKFSSSQNVVALFLNADGSGKSGPTAFTTGYTLVRNPRIAWAGDGWVVAWAAEKGVSEKGVYLASLAPDGTKVGADVVVDALATSPDERQVAVAVAPGLGVGVAWHKYVGSGRSDIYFRRFTVGLAQVGEAMTLTSSGESLNPTIAWDGTGFGVAWKLHETADAGDHVAFARVACK